MSKNGEEMKKEKGKSKGSSIIKIVKEEVLQESEVEMPDKLEKCQTVLVVEVVVVIVIVIVVLVVVVVVIVIVIVVLE